MSLNTRAWLRFSLVNLCIVAFLGMVMRYKIGFEFPFLDQKYLQHAHSHFAFAGWVTQTLMILMLQYLVRHDVQMNVKRYNVILAANLVSAYGMLVSFALTGYSAPSIAFSVASIFCGYVFGYRFLKDLNKLNPKWLSRNWFRLAIAFNWLSSLGTFALAYMMATKSFSESLYLSSVYFYLHFHYNGWFFFACMGLLYGWLHLQLTDRPAHWAFALFAVAAIPTFLLSILWLELPAWLYAVTVIASIGQFVAWVIFMRIGSVKIEFGKLPGILRLMLRFIAIATTVKLALQLASVTPSVSKLAFGFRPIVIAYLHLVLLAMISLFLLSYAYAKKLLPLPQGAKIGLSFFTIGVVANEIVLGIQGIGALGYVYIPYGNALLFGISIVLLTGISAAAYATISASKKDAI